KKFRPQEILPGCKSLIFTGLNYYQPRGDVPPGHGLVARYAWGRDYHKVLGKRLQRIAAGLRELFPGERFFTFVDATPLAERSFAARAGVGFIGRNTLLIRKGYGSWFFLGGIATTLEPDPAWTSVEQNSDGSPGACPPGCTRCIDACPTGALLSPYRIDARKCISYLTIEHKGFIDKERAAEIGDWLFGCDVCQEVCPFNRAPEKTYVVDFLSPRAGGSLYIEDVLSIKSTKEFSQRFAGSPLQRAKRSGLIRNACVCAVNLSLTKLRPKIAALTADNDQTVAKQAAWAAEELR
ncbi:MAG: tRNA epoxyqueuosine(34) reductase QueG, partial [Chitinispirillaceae bacterium]|nr:tRNA epoxyqueuosine(34) reductase QueG [Chitinispirillaceae bacterium]